MSMSILAISCGGRGCDLAKGQRTLAKGERIRTATIALLASQGFGDVTVGGEVKAAIISTGDELVISIMSGCKIWCSRLQARRNAPNSRHYVGDGGQDELLLP